MEAQIMTNADSVGSNGREAITILFQKAHDFAARIFGSPAPQIDDAIAPWLALTHIHHGLGTTTSNIDSGHQTAAAVRHGITERTFLRAVEPAQSEQCVAGLVWKFPAHARHPDWRAGFIAVPPGDVLLTDPTPRYQVRHDIIVQRTSFFGIH